MFDFSLDDFDRLPVCRRYHISKYIIMDVRPVGSLPVDIGFDKGYPEPEVRGLRIVLGVDNDSKLPCERISIEISEKGLWSRSGR